MSRLRRHDEAVRTFDEAIASYDQALDIHHRLTADGQPSAAEPGVWKGKSHALLRSEQFEAALDAAQRAIEILEPLAADGPVSLQFELSWALHWKGRALERLQRPFEASDCQRRASELIDAFKPTGENQT